MSMIARWSSLFSRRPATLGGPSQHASAKSYIRSALADIVEVSKRMNVALRLAEQRSTVTTAWREMASAVWVLETMVELLSSLPEAPYNSAFPQIMANLCGAVHERVVKGSLSADLRDILLKEVLLLTPEGARAVDKSRLGTGALDLVEFRLPPELQAPLPEITALLRACKEAAARALRSSPDKRLLLASAAMAAIMFAAPGAGMLDADVAALAADVMRRCIGEDSTPARLCEMLFEDLPMIQQHSAMLVVHAFDGVRPMLLCLARLGIAHFVLLPLVRRLKDVPQAFRSMLLAAIAVSRSATSLSRSVMGRSDVEQRIHEQQILLIHRTDQVAANVIARMERRQPAREASFKAPSSTRSEAESECSKSECSESECCVCLASAEDGCCTMLVLDCTRDDPAPVDHVVCDECWEQIAGRAKAQPPLCPMCRRPADPLENV